MFFSGCLHRQSARAQNSTLWSPYSSSEWWLQLVNVVGALPWGHQGLMLLYFPKMQLNTKACCDWAMPGFHTTCNDKNYTLYTANWKNRQKHNPGWLSGHWRALGCEQIWRTLLWYWQEPPLQPLINPSYIWSLSPCPAWPRAGSFTAALLAKRPIFWHCDHPTEALTHKNLRHSAAWHQNTGSSKAQNCMCCSFVFSSALLLIQRASRFKPYRCLCLYIYFFIAIMYCHHPTSIIAHMLRQHPTVLLLVPRLWAASLKHALTCTEVNPAWACVTLRKLFQDHTFLTTPHCCVLHMEDICIQISL